MTENLTDDAYARAALTYLAEPADRWLGQLIEAHGAVAALDAIRTGRPAPVRSPARGPAAAGRRARRRWNAGGPGCPSCRPGSRSSPSASRESRLVSPGDAEWPGQLADLGDERPYALWLRGQADLRFNCLRSVAGRRLAGGDRLRLLRGR